MKEYDFEKQLFKNEKIIYQGKPVPGSGSKDVGGLIFVLILTLLIQSLLIFSVVFKIGEGANGINLNFIIIFLVTLILDMFIVYGIVYKLFIKKKSIKDDFYCLTDRRALKYESKKDKLVYGYLANYDDIHCNSIKNGYGDVYMGIIYQETGDSKVDLSNIKKLSINPDIENMPFILFESIESPMKIAKLAREAREELKKKT